MNYANIADSVGAYQKIATHSEVFDASPHRLIQMLLSGALEKIAIAKGHMERGDVNHTGSHISWAIAIIDGLRMSLDKTIDSPIADNLNRLYEYMGMRLLNANIQKDPKMLEEVSNLLKTIKSGWDGIQESAGKS